MTSGPAGASPEMDRGTRLGYERTYLAHERTQLAWVRTGLAAISFGFGIAKFFQYLHQQQGVSPPLLGGYTVGMVMIGIGLVGLTLANLQHWRAMRALRKECPGLPPSVAGGKAILIMVLGLLAFFGALVRH